MFKFIVSAVWEFLGFCVRVLVEGLFEGLICGTGATVRRWLGFNESGSGFLDFVVGCMVLVLAGLLLAAVVAGG